jgi:DNA modification methylase
MINFITGDSSKELSTLKQKFQSIVTSPPYFQCRVYENDDNGLGQENSPDLYVKNLCDILQKALDLLNDDGVMWINIGDSIAKRKYPDLHIKIKESIGIPWMVAQELRKRGYYIRQEIIWKKVNPMPNSVSDMCVPSHESIFVVTKSPKYYFDVKSIEEDAITTTKPPGTSYEKFGGTKRANGDNVFYSGKLSVSTGKRRKRDVWEEPTAKCKINHAAAYPESLIKPCILASSKEGDFILDPFSGTGTTGIVCKNLNRNFIGIEKNESYNTYARERCGIPGEYHRESDYEQNDNSN